MQPTLKDLEELVRGAGKIVLDGYGSTLKVTYKSSLIDPVTDVDQRSEAYLLDELRNRFPEHGIVSEEGGGWEGNGGHQWFIDPLDGTVNFSHGLPVFCVSVAYSFNGVMQLGAIYDPTRNELFSAERGRGAFLNGQPIHVSQVDNLDRCLLTTGFPYDIRTNPNNNLKNYATFAVRTQAVRRMGSAALDLCYVACGRFDGYWEIRLFPWDFAAGGLIAEEAGAKITDLSGGVPSLAGPLAVIVANPGLHAKIFDVLKGE